MDNRQAKITWHPKTNKLSEVPSEGLEYALISKDNHQIHQLVRCKDFIHDVIYPSINKMSLSVYGLTYEPITSPQVCLDSMKLIITNFKDKEFEKNLREKCLPLLHHVEGRLKMKKTKVTKCMKSHPVYRFSGVWLLESSKQWMQSIPMISFYTFLIRVGMIHDPNDTLEQTLQKLIDETVNCYYDKQVQGGRDCEIAMDAECGIYRIMTQGVKNTFGNTKKNFPSFQTIGEIKKKYYGSNYVNIYDIHDGCGLTSFSSGQTKKIFPHWHKQKG